MALSANREVDRYVDQELRTLPVKGTTHIYKGALVGLAGGLARGLVAGDAFAGVAYEEVDNSGGGDGDAMVRVYTMGDFVHALGGASVANNLEPAFASADNTLTLTAAGNSFVGRQVSVVDSGSIVLRIMVGAGIDPIAEQTALTAQLTTITHTAPSSADYALQNLVQNSGFGFATADEGNTALSALANLQVRLAQLETKLQAVGALA